MNILHKLGLTPIYTRLAANYLQKGVGIYSCDKFGYDSVHVLCDTEWGNQAREGISPIYAMVMRVEFYAEGRREKWVEFRVSLAGGGGDPVLKAVPSNLT